MTPREGFIKISIENTVERNGVILPVPTQAATRCSVVEGNDEFPAGSKLRITRGSEMEVFGETIVNVANIILVE